MDVKSVLFLLLVAVALAKAQEKCCFADQYELLDGQITATVVSGQGIVQRVVVQYAFDYTNRRQAELVQRNGIMYQYVIDYNKQAIYVVNLSMKTCQKLPLPTSVMEHCVPSNATYVGSFYAGDHKLTADTFTYSVKDEESVTGNFTLSVTKGDCIPFSQSFIGSSQGMNTVSVAGFVNYSPGIPDPSKYFDLPNYCPTFYIRKPKEGLGPIPTLMLML